MLRNTCAKCKREMTCLKNEIAVIHFIDNDKSKGIDVMVSGDLWGCSKCGAEIVTGFGKQRLGYDLSEKETKNILEHHYIEIKRSTTTG